MKFNNLNIFMGEFNLTVQLYFTIACGMLKIYKVDDRDSALGTGPWVRMQALCLKDVVLVHACSALYS